MVFGLVALQVFVDHLEWGRSVKILRRDDSAVGLMLN